MTRLTGFFVGFIQMILLSGPHRGFVFSGGLPGVLFEYFIEVGDVLESHHHGDISYGKIIAG